MEVKATPNVRAIKPAPALPKTLTPGLQQLQTEGIDLKALGGSTVCEVLIWHPMPEDPPIAGESLLVQYVCPVDGTKEVCSAWWDGDETEEFGWRECATGGPLEAKVLFWADPQGPR